MGRRKKEDKPLIDISKQEEQYFSKRTIVDMATKGIGHSQLKKVLHNLNKKK